MPTVPFDSLPDDARTWVFGSDKPLNEQETKLLLAGVDQFLADWQAHGEPLTAARNFSDNRFLTVAVDQNTAYASGCSIDGLFRSLKDIERQIGTSLLDSTRVYYEDGSGIRSVSRTEFSRRGVKGKITGETTVYDPTVTTLGEWRGRFRSTAANSWHAGLLSK